MYLAIFILVILSAIALFLFQYMNQRRKIRQDEMHDRKRQQFEELLKLISDKNADPDRHLESDPDQSGQAKRNDDDAAKS